MRAELASETKKAVARLAVLAKKLAIPAAVDRQSAGKSSTSSRKTVAKAMSIQRRPTSALVTAAHV
eukprot:CAMPEP_0168486814 /NCGR_PEP_ID=MMETSP0228-20121227/67315_1 /TAXON_ID=133427 /ORGANISM="Protoceratium reticulatum, Strain CCCM 535 (=CCMP 1889)" /LENGTH=65 /DNA_ID=CAMNT_0008503413 /DNA_START=69 /DNA_END=262 /DNA_ORIENTATION=-